MEPVQHLSSRITAGLIRDAAALVFMRLFNYYSTGHCWKIFSGTTLKSMRLYLERWLTDKASVPTGKKVNEVDSSMETLFRRALHSVCVRAGMAWLFTRLPSFSPGDANEVKAAAERAGLNVPYVGLVEEGFWSLDALLARRIRVVPSWLTS